MLYKPLICRQFSKTTIYDIAFPGGQQCMKIKQCNIAWYFQRTSLTISQFYEKLCAANMRPWGLGKTKSIISTVQFFSSEKCLAFLPNIYHVRNVNRKNLCILDHLYETTSFQHHCSFFQLWNLWASCGCCKMWSILSSETHSWK